MILIDMLFYFYGDNSYSKSKQIAKIKHSYISKTGSSADMEVFDMSDRTLSDLLNALAVVPMFVSSRLIIVKNLFLLKLEKDKIDKIISSVPDSTNLIITDHGVDKRSVYFKTLSKLKNAKEFKNLSPHMLVAWVKNMAQVNGSSIDNRSINFLIDKVGLDQWQLENEILKLSSYSQDITIDSIEKLVVPNLNQTAFMMLDYIGQGNPDKAVNLYKKLILSGEADQLIIGAITYQYRIMALAMYGGSNSDWQKELSVSPYALSKARNLIRNKEMSYVKKAYELILSTDLSIKTGSQDSQSAVQDLINNLSVI